MMFSSPSASTAQSSRTRSTSQRRSTVPRSVLMTAFFAFWAQECSAFTVEMNYKPPVKSSVKKLYDRRFPPADGSSSSSRPTSRKSAHASAMAPPAPSGPVDFERRMRDLLFAPQNQPPVPSHTTLPSNVQTVETLAEYKTVVGDEDTRLVVVRFHATYCRACMAVAPHFYRCAAQNPNVVFVDVPVTQSNASLHQGLGVPSLPYAHIYHPQSGLVEEMKLTRKDFAEFREKLRSYTEGLCEVSVS